MTFSRILHGTEIERLPEARNLCSTGSLRFAQEGSILKLTTQSQEVLLNRVASSLPAPTMPVCRGPDTSLQGHVVGIELLLILVLAYMASRASGSDSPYGPTS